MVPPDRSALIRLASALPKGSSERVSILRSLRANKKDFGKKAGRTIHLVDPDNRGFNMCGEKTYADAKTVVPSESTCYYCKLTYEKKMKKASGPFAVIPEELEPWGNEIGHRIYQLKMDISRMEKKLRDAGRAWAIWDADALWKAGILDDKEVGELEELVEELKGRRTLR